MANKKSKLTPKTILKLPDLEQSKSAVLNSLTSRSSQRSYDHAIREFTDWYCSEPRLAFNKTVVTRYRINLEQAKYASSTINLRLAAIRRLAYEAADCGLLSPDLAAGIRRVKGVKKHGMRIGNWLTADQGKRLLTAFGGDDLRSRRDYAMIAVLLGCGLRRAEVGGNSRVSIERILLHTTQQANSTPSKPPPTGTGGPILLAGFTDRLVAWAPTCPHRKCKRTY
jgi:site-specific recombinase XerD